MTEFEERFPDLYLSSESESAARAAATLPTEGSEDASNILGQIKLAAEEIESPDRNEYLPESSSEWVVSLALPPGTTLPARRVADLFDKKWRERYGGLTIYGKNAESGWWTYLISSDGSKGVTGLKFAWPYYATWVESPRITTQQLFSDRVEAIRTAIHTITAEFTVDVSMDFANAEARSRFLSTLTERLGSDVTLCVRAPDDKQFDGREIWDVMLCLGLQWGDMDCFHWQNESGLGDDFFFSVWTTTLPGYFLPEQIAANQTHVDDLGFSFSLPRCRKPEAVFDSMFAAAKYVQQRLGGTITDADGNPIVSVEHHKTEISRRVNELTNFGFAPGSDAALRFF